MKQVGSLLKNVHVDLADIVADVDELNLIVDDLRSNGGPWTPTSNWLTLDPRLPHNDDGEQWLDRSFSSAAVEARMSTMDKMLAPWIGTIQMEPAAGAAAERFRPWLAHHDPLGLWRTNFEDPAVAAKLVAADLGSAMDLNLLWSFMTDSHETTSVLEVGGGYGRLAEVTLNVFRDVKYVLVDAVPGSLLYAKEYLRRSCPHARIGYYYDRDPFDPAAFDCYIVPSWHLEAVNTMTYDACVNIESFQEMKPHHVDGYLRMFDRLSSQGALIYVSNFQNAELKRSTEILAGSTEWQYPSTWRRLLCANSPRSTMPDHPAEVFTKEGRDWSGMNGQVQAAQKWQAAQVRAASPQSLPREGVRLVRRAGSAALRRLLRPRSR